MHPSLLNRFAGSGRHQVRSAGSTIDPRSGSAKTELSATAVTGPRPPSVTRDSTHKYGNHGVRYRSHPASAGLGPAPTTLLDRRPTRCGSAYPPLPPVSGLAGLPAADQGDLAAGQHPGDLPRREPVPDREIGVLGPVAHGELGG